MRREISEKDSTKALAGSKGAASEPNTPAESQTGSVGSESGKPHLFAPLRPSPHASSEEKRPFLGRERGGHKYTGLPSMLSSFARWLRLQRLAEEHVKSKGLQSLGKDTFKRPLASPLGLDEPKHPTQAAQRPQFPLAMFRKRSIRSCGAINFIVRVRIFFQV